MNNPAVAFNPAVALLMVRVIERSIILLAGLLLIYLGYRLFIAGVSGKASLKAKNGDRNFEFLNAAPGLFFCLFGFVLLSTMSFKTITVSLPTVEGAINVLLADALEEGKEHSTDGPLPEDAAEINHRPVGCSGRDERNFSSRVITSRRTRFRPQAALSKFVWYYLLSAWRK